MRIDWDGDKAEANRAKHGVEFERVREFQFDTSMREEDRRFDYGEKRIQALGYIDDRLHVLVYTIRDTHIRVISLRRANSRERRRYDE